MVEKLQIVAFTHKQTEIEKIGCLHLSEESQSIVLPAIKSKFEFNEFMFLSTCNRVELIFNSAKIVDQQLLSEILMEINPSLTKENLSVLVSSASFYKGIGGVEHMYQVASSLDSLVIGEREIITQVRKAYEMCNKLGITGDLIRLVIKQ